VVVVNWLKHFHFHSRNQILKIKKIKKRKILPGKSQSVSLTQNFDFELLQLLEPSRVHFAKSSLRLAMLSLLTF